MHPTAKKEKKKFFVFHKKLNKKCSAKIQKYASFHSLNS